MIIDILTIHNLLQQQLDVMLKLFANPIIICHTKQVFEFCKNAFVLPGVKLGFLFGF